MTYGDRTRLTKDGAASKAPAPGQGTKRPTRAVVTIASANYLARARALCRSLKQTEPDVRRFLVVVDRPRLELAADEPFEVVWIDQVPIPELDDFMAQYDVTEANTAVKPYVMQYVFDTYGIDQLVYLDPDILVLSPLEEVWRGLDRGNVVLTPHLRDPYRDGEQPSELLILRAGTYNLGFIGLRRGPAADRLLTWWGDKTENDCVIDWANGLFVDQKWMDLVPGYVEGVVVLRDAGYNVAYWNLHEREVTEVAGAYFADGRPIAFFHFSGYDPRRPWVLSKHQFRHHLRSMPALKGLCDLYAVRLRADGHDAVASHRYGFSALTNGIPTSPPLRWAVRLFRTRGIRYPSVVLADEFCRFVMTPNAAVSGTEIAPLVRYVLDSRPDVLAAYPGAVQDARDPGLLNWLANCSHEVESDALYARFKDSLVRVNPFDRLRSLHESREDLRSAFPDAFSTLEGHEKFVSWLLKYGVEEGLDREEAEAFALGGRIGFEKVVEYYFSKPELHPAYPLALLPCGRDFIEWLTRHATADGSLTLTEIRWFEQRLRTTDQNLLGLLLALRNHWLRLRFPLGATAFGWPELCTFLRGEAARRNHQLPPFSDEPPPRVGVLLQLEMLHGSGTYGAEYPRAKRDRESLREFAEGAVATASPLRPLAGRLRNELETALQNYAPKRGVNVAGYFHYAAGVGSSVRSLVRTLEAGGVPHEDIPLPVCPSATSSGDREFGTISRFWKQHRIDFDVAITVANADAMRVARAYLGRSYEQGRKHIGYWIWETTQLPGNYAHAAEGLAAIWTPSEFSAASIRKTLGTSIPVEVVPHAVVARKPFDPRPSTVALPEKRTLIGFFFDARSVVERKNPEALLRAFRLAFRPDDKVSLVLKVSHAEWAARTMRRLEALAEGLPVVWIRDVRLDDLQTSVLLNRLDVYASLHRAEGFGLVIAEAMALGKAVVATGFSGNMEFMDDECARVVRHREVVTDRSHGPYPRGTRWAEPDVEHAAELLRELALDRGRREELGRHAQARIEQTLAPRVVARSVRRLLGWEDGRELRPDADAPGRASTTPKSEAPRGRLAIPNE